MSNNRREFLKTSTLAIGGMLILPSCFHKPTPFRFFTQSEADCLIAICECIIPADDAPGATDAGVIYYIDKQVAGFFIKSQSMYRIGLQAVQEDCQLRFKLPFEKLSVEKQVAFLELFEQDDASLKSWNDISPSRFFNMVISHTMQGFYGAPRHGGNKNYMSYTMLGIGYPQVIGQNRYEKGGDNE